MKSFVAPVALLGVCVLGVSAQSTTCTPFSSQTGCPAVYDPCCAFNCIAAGGMFSSCLDFDDTRPQVLCSACPSNGQGTAVPTTTSTPTSVQTATSAPASTCTPYFLMTGCPKVYDPCCAFNCISAGGRGSTCLDYDDTRPQVVCKACPVDPVPTTVATTTTAPAPETTEATTVTSSSSTGTCTPYFLMTGCPKVYDPCCAFNCIAAGGRGSTCLDYDDTRPQVVCEACPSGTAVSETSSAGGYSSAIQTSIVPGNSTTSAGVSSSVIPPIETSAGPTSGNASTSAPVLPTPTKDHDSGAAMVSVGAALGLGLLCAVLAL
ncbi:hypothetical protein TWF281_002350 [Arthrobotrys megalospora]